MMHDTPLTPSTLAEIPEDLPPKSFETKSGLEIKIALGNYRMFFTPGTEDYFHRFSKDAKDTAATSTSESEAAEQGKKKLEEFVNAKLGLDSMDVDAPPAAATTTAAA
jgi:paired amphipathic helix protein Sin3a